MKKLRVKDFAIKCQRTGNQLRGHENEVVWEIFTADWSKRVKTGFYRKADAAKWLSENVKTANKIIAGEIKV